MEFQEQQVLVVADGLVVAVLVVLAEQYQPHFLELSQ
jgi:hypothetical protein